MSGPGFVGVPVDQCASHQGVVRKGRLCRPRKAFDEAAGGVSRPPSAFGAGRPSRVGEVARHHRSACLRDRGEPRVAPPAAGASSATTSSCGARRLSSGGPAKSHPWHCDIESCAPEGGFVSVWIGLLNTQKESSPAADTGIPHSMACRFKRRRGARACCGTDRTR